LIELDTTMDEKMKKQLLSFIKRIEG